MYRIVNLSNKWYGIKTCDCIDDFYYNSDESSSIQQFINEGTPVILVNEIEDFTSILDVEVEIIE